MEKKPAVVIYQTEGALPLMLKYLLTQKTKESSSIRSFNMCWHLLSDILKGDMSVLYNCAGSPVNRLSIVSLMYQESQQYGRLGFQTGFSAEKNEIP